MLNDFRIRLTIRLFILCLAFCCILNSEKAFSYGILSHAAVIELAWKKDILPLLKQKFPQSTGEELNKALPYVYGGSLLPDIGYYPLGSRFFSDLVHYTRSGDFLEALLQESDSLNEYAFALGMLCHYEADSHGHSMSTNEAVAILFPRLKKKYGDTITYEEAPTQHVRVEFGFDVLQTALGNYKPETLTQFIGFEMADSVLERAFYKTYGLHIRDIFTDYSAAVSLFRFTVRSIVPGLTRDAWKVQHSVITRLNPIADKEQFQYKCDKKKYRKEFPFKRPQSLLITTILTVMPRVGMLSRFKPKSPNAEAKRLFEKSFSAIRSGYTASLKKLGSGNSSFANIDLDTGHKTIPGEYKSADKTYRKLLKKLSATDFSESDDSLKQHLRNYFKSGEHPSPLTKKDRKRLYELDQNIAAQSR